MSRDLNRPAPPPGDMQTDSEPAAEARWERYLPWLAIVLGPVLLLGSDLARGRALFWGTPLLQFVPWRQYALEVLASGRLPLWNPLLGMGAPLLANYQSAFFYPPNWILSATGVPWGQTLLVALHLAWAGAGMVLLIRGLGWRPLAQLVGGLAYGMSGYLVARSGFLSINAAAAWLPWILIGVERLADAQVPGVNSRSRVNAMAWLGLALGLQWLAGHAQTAWYTLLLAVAWWIWRTWRRPQVREFPRVGLWFLAALAVAFTLAAVQLVPTLEYLAQSHRSSPLDRAAAWSYSFWPWRLISLIAPDVFGSPAMGDYWGYANYWEDAIYVGVLPLLLALAALLKFLPQRGQNGSRARFWLGVAVASLVLALGRNTPVFPFLYEYVPTFGLFQAPTRWNLLLVTSLALLAALGAERWEPATRRKLYWLRLGTAGAGVIGLATLLGPLLLGDIRASFIRAFVVAGLGIFTSGLLALFRREGRQPVWTLVAAAFVLVDLSWSGSGLNPATGIELYQSRSRLSERVDLSHRIYMHPQVEDEVKFEHAFRFDTYGALDDWRWVRDVGLPNTAMLEGIASANNFDPILPERFAHWMETLATTPQPKQMQLLALMDVGAAALSADPGGEPSYELIQAPGRVRTVPQALAAADGDQALETLLEPGFDPDEQVVVEAPAPEVEGREGAPASASIQPGDNPQELRVDVRAPGGSWLLVSDLWYPGWGVEVDGVPAKLYRTDFLFRGVWVPPGSSEVVFRYRPVSFAIGAAISSLAWLTLALATMGWRRR